jgi:type IX secretion system PorP/SprF family membrane protein
MKKTLKKVVLFLFCFQYLIIQNAFTQQAAQYTIYMYNPYGVHPAYAGMENSLVATGVIRQQWNKLPAAPSTQQINAHLPFNMISSGFGINIENDKAGVAQTLSAALTYAYRIRLNKNGILSMALNGGFLQQTLNGADIKTPSGTYNGNDIDHKDKILFINQQSGQAPLLDASVFFQQNKVKIGFTAKNLLGQTINYTINSNKIRLFKNYLFTFATDLKLSSNFLVKPSLLIRSDLVQLQSELSVMSEINQKFSLGASYRGFTKNANDALAIVGGIKLNDAYTLYYSYDITLSSLKNNSTGSHELLFRYNLGREIGKGRPAKIIYNPRYY